jgi:hypothetical protein
LIVLVAAAPSHRTDPTALIGAIVLGLDVASHTSSGDGDRAKAKAPSLPRLHQLLIHKFERFGADTDISSEWIVHSG